MSFKHKNNLFFEEKQVAALLNIYEHRKEKRYATLIHINTKITYAHLTKEILPAFKKISLITITKISRIKYISITQKGIEIAKAIIKLKNMVGK